MYRPTFESVSLSTAVKTKSQVSKSVFARCVRVLVRLSFLGAAGSGAYHGYHHRKTWITVLESLLERVRGTGGHFWIGFGAASVAQFVVILGAASWAAVKLDTQQDFTAWPAHRPTKAAALITYASPEISPKCQLDPRQWQKLTLHDKMKVSSNVYHFVFSLPHSDLPLGLPIGQHVAIHATISGRSVSRSYTPVSNNSDVGHVGVLVKVYPTGVMTKYLEGLKVGDEVEFRGPKGAMRYTRNLSRYIGMIAGGTGITPMYQVIRAICSDPADNTQVSLLYANDSEADILLKENLDSLAKQYPQKFQVHYVLVIPPSGWTGSVGFVTADLIRQKLAEPSDDSRVLLCGPPPMLTAMKEALSGLGYQEPNLVSRMTDQVFLF